MVQPPRPRVAVTGLGLVTPAGCDGSDFLESVNSGRSGIRLLDCPELAGCRTRIAATVPDFDPGVWLSEKESSRLDRATQMAVVAAAQALQDAGLWTEKGVPEPERFGVALGTGAGCVKALERSHEAYFSARRTDVFAIPRAMSHAPAANVSIRYGLEGFNVTVSTACSSGALAIGLAFREIRAGGATRMLAGGAEAPLTPAQIETWAAVRALSKANDEPEKAMKPFSRNRDGFVLGEGAALVVLEELESALLRGARIYGELVGFGSSSDAFHITAPSAEGEAAAIRAALRDASLVPEQIDYINAHGTATALNDKTETQAIQRVFGARRVPVSSIKPVTGHMLAASGAAELAASVLAARDGCIPPTLNYEEPDPECDLDHVVGRPRQASLEHVLSSSFGFGGNNAVLAARRWDGR
jgi:3-oxoacyl-[acyl-carrier-protein] synthase II